MHPPRSGSATLALAAVVVACGPAFAEGPLSLVDPVGGIELTELGGLTTTSTLTGRTTRRAIGLDGTLDGRLGGSLGQPTAPFALEWRPAGSGGYRAYRPSSIASARRGASPRPGTVTPRPGGLAGVTTLNTAGLRGLGLKQLGASPSLLGSVAPSGGTNRPGNPATAARQPASRRPSTRRYAPPVGGVLGTAADARLGAELRYRGSAGSWDDLSGVVSPR